jgi:ubiquinone/menaquinone biosynthesis C-methylase UbiE
MSTNRKHIEQVQSLFDVWADNGRAEGMETGHFPMAKPAFDKLNLGPEQRYLDIGCGNGYSVRWAASDPTVDAIGLDLSEAMILRARALSGDFPNTRFIHAPFPLPILKAKTFDAIFSMEVFYYLKELQWALVSTIRLLKPGGLFACVVDFYEENEASHSWPEDIGIELNLLSKAGWRKEMTDVGFEIVEQTQLVAPPGDEPENWRQTHGSLLTLGRRPD